MDPVVKLRAAEITADLENWMARLPKELRSLPLINLAVPGSHDSMTWSIHRKSEMAPDADPVLQRLKFLGPLWRATMYRWSVTQTYDVLKQLKAGIRYFDLRVGTKVGTEDIFFVHGLYADEVRGFLGDLKNFLRMHSQEVVILDCKHFYAFDTSDHERFISLLTTTYTTTLLPWMDNMSNLTLDSMTAKAGHQVIIVYRSDAALYNQPLLWPSASWPTPWHDTVSVSKLLCFLNKSVKFRNSTKGLISQCLLAPTPGFIVKHMFSTLKAKCAIKFEKDKLRWIKDQKPGAGGINIIISDFIEISEFKFSKAVISLNAKLLQ